MNEQAKMMAERGLLPAPVLAEKAGVTVYTVYRWIKLGKVRGEKAGAHWYIDKASAAAYLGPTLARRLDEALATCQQCSREYVPSGASKDDGFCSDSCAERHDEELTAAVEKRRQEGA